MLGVERTLSSLLLAGLVTVAGLVDTKPAIPPTLPAKKTHEISLSLLPFREARAEEWIRAAYQPWQTNHWLPLAEDVARARGTVTLDESLEIFNKLQKDLLGVDNNLQPTFRWFANDYLRRFPGTREWAGFCHGVAHLNLDPEPARAPEIFTLKSGGQVRVTYLVRLGIGAAFRSGDLMNRPFLGEGDRSYPTWFVQENLDYFMDRFIQEGTPFIINAARPGQTGYWYRTVWGISPDRLLLLASNLNAPGEPWTVIPRDRVREVYTPVPQAQGRVAGLDERLFAEIPAGWRFDHLMDEGLVERVLLGP